MSVHALYQRIEHGAIKWVLAIIELGPRHLQETQQYVLMSKNHLPTLNTKQNQTYTFTYSNSILWYCLKFGLLSFHYIQS